MRALSERPSSASASDAGSGPAREVLQTFHLYATKSRLYLVACGSSRREWRILKLARSLELDVAEDSATYSEAECARLLQEIHDGNRNVGGLKLLCTAHGVAGLVRFLDGFYLLLITRRRYLGRICNHPVYGMDEVKLQPLAHPDSAGSLSGRERAHEQRYQRLLMQVLDKKDEFFFSYTYNLHLTLQANLTQPNPAADAPRDAFSSMFVWNQYLTKELRNALGNADWVLPLVHGFWQQRSLSLFGRILRVTLVARRSRHFAGTRYRKRGVNKQGYVANDVETEQVVDASGDWAGAVQKLASVVQVRGSIPLFWSQEEATLTAPKPDIHLQHFDPLFNATRLHFKDLAFRYGCPITVLNLVKALEKSPRESLLGEEFHDAIRYLNMHLPEDENIRYIPFDFRKMKRTASHDVVIASICKIVRDATRESGICCFQLAPDGPSTVAGAGSSSAANSLSGSDSGLWDADLTTMEHRVAEPDDDFFDGGGGRLKLTCQAGVLRTNCIDCLDRTNVAQFALGLVALGQQLQALGITESEDIDAGSTMSVELGHMYEAMGNCLAQQYGGSDAHTKFFKDQRGQWSARTQGEDVMTSLRRFYSNINTDPEKQDAMNLFLGRFVPQLGKPPVWELGNDAHLHASRGLLLDEDNFDIFWGEALGQPPAEAAQEQGLQAPSSLAPLLGSGDGLLGQQPPWGTAGQLGGGLRAVPSWASSTLSSATTNPPSLNNTGSSHQRGLFERPFHSASDFTRVARMMDMDACSACSDSSLDFDAWSLGRSSRAETRVRSASALRAPPFTAWRNGTSGANVSSESLMGAPPRLLFLDEMLSQEPNRVTEVRLYVPSAENEEGAHHHADGSTLDLAGDIPAGRLHNFSADSGGLRSSHPIFKHHAVQSSADSRQSTADCEAREFSPAALLSPLSEASEEALLLGAMTRASPADGGLPAAPLRHRPGPRSPEMGWPVHPLMSLPVEIDTAGGAEQDVRSQVDGQMLLLWDTIVMDWIHGKNGSLARLDAPTPQKPLADNPEMDCLKLLQTFPEDADLAAAYISPTDADSIFSQYASGPVRLDPAELEASDLFSDIASSLSTTALAPCAEVINPHDAPHGLLTSVRP